MRARKYTPRRAGIRWREGAPDYILDCFDNPQFADRYTIWFGKELAFHVKRDGSIGQGPDQYHNTYLTGIGTSENGGVSGSLEYKAHEVAAHRYREKHRRVRWLDLPEATRRLVMGWAEA